MSSVRSGASAGHSSPSIPSASGVGANATVIRSSSSTAWSAAGEARVSSSSTRCSVAPAARYGQTSHTDASKPSPASCVARSASVTPNASRCHPTRFVSPPCVTSTPLGVPVEPEV